jgi:hypothetical protein
MTSDSLAEIANLFARAFLRSRIHQVNSKKRIRQNSVDEIAKAEPSCVHANGRVGDEQ